MDADEPTHKGERPSVMEAIKPDVYGHKRKKLMPPPRPGGRKNTTTQSPFSVNNSIASTIVNEAQPQSVGAAVDSDDDTDVPCDTLAALYHLRDLFPKAVIGDRLFPVAFTHQLYAIVPDKTLVDSQLADLKQKGTIRLARLGHSANEFLVYLDSDLSKFIQSSVIPSVRDPETTKPLIEKFHTEVLLKVRDVSIAKHTLISDFGFTDNQLTLLIQSGLLNTRGVDSFWISIPGAGLFTKQFYAGRTELLQIIRRNKYKEMLESDLEKRKLKSSKLPVQFHIADLIGAEIVTCVETAAGRLLRLIQPSA